MKKTNLLILLPLLIACGNAGSINDSSDNISASNSETIVSTESSSSSSSSKDVEVELPSIREREYNAQVLIGEMVNSMAKQSNGSGKKSKRILNQNDEDNVVGGFYTESLNGEGPETKSLNEPLSQAFGIISYFRQFNKSENSIFETIFYDTYDRAIYDEETGNYVGSEECYKSQLVIKDYPNSEYKMLYIRYWSNYNYLILMDDNDNFSILNEYADDYSYKFDENGRIIGYSDNFKTHFNIFADDHFISAYVNTTDYNNDVIAIKDGFNEFFDENNFQMCKFLIEEYYNLYKTEDGLYDMSVITDKNENIDPNDDKYVHIDTLNEDGYSYLYYGNLASAFMHKNYDMVCNFNGDILNEFFEVEDTTIIGLKHINNLIEIPDSITSIEKLLEEKINFEGSSPKYRYGKGLYIPSSVTSLGEKALVGNEIDYISHIFVDYYKDECPYVDILENSEAEVFYKDEFELISGVYLPILETL